MPSRAHPVFNLYSSNRLERLSAQLVNLLAQPPRNPFEPDIIVVQSNGMRRWLTQQIAEQQGICANVQFPFPQRFFADLLEALLPNTDRSRLYERETMTWRIMHLLPTLDQATPFAAIANYLGGENRPLRTYQLAREIAHVFDQYIVFRPAMVLEWDRGKGHDWQAILWRELQKPAPGQHQAALGMRLAEALSAHKFESSKIPQRICVFGIASLLPFYLELFDQLSAVCDVHLFLMQPTPAWWGDMSLAREKARPSTPQLELSFQAEHSEIENPLLAANGKVARDFLHNLFEFNHDDRDYFEQPANDTILHCVQRDIFDLRDRSRATEKTFAAVEDYSLQVHSCHSPVRELEILHDQLLAGFERDPSLKPKDIVVMMPDIGVYAPFIDAVFGVPEKPAHQIPYSIADRAPRSSSGVIDTFFRVIEVARGRFGASEVLAILESPAVQRKFEIATGETKTINRWVNESGIRWGIDDAHRERLGLPRFADNSWRAGLDRMLLGYALAGDGRQLFDNILPFEEIEGSSADLFGNFVSFVERLFAVAHDLTKPRALSKWTEDFRRALNDFLLPDETAEHELNQLRRTIDRLNEISAISEHHDTIPAEVALAQLEDLLGETGTGAGFLSGKMTFCALKPMRSIPFKVVCLLGLNDTAYPRHDRPPTFDLIAQNPKRGDRNIRDGDRALFLELLLSARDVFYISYLGRSLRDNSELPPSVLVSELVDYVTQSFALDSEKVVVDHPLQAFSPRNFGSEDKRCLTYSLVNSIAGDVAGAARHDALPFFDQPLSEPEEEWREVELAKLTEFFSHPAKFFLRYRLGIELPREREEIEDREPFELHSLDRYAIEQRLVADALAGIDPKDCLSAVRASGVLPPAGEGSLIFEGLCESARTFAGAVGNSVAPETAPPMMIRAPVGDFTLNGTLDRIRGYALVHFRLTELKAKDFLRIWIEHLARNLSEQKPAILFGKEKGVVASYQFPPVENAQDILTELLALYWRGLREPLPLFPRSSWAFAGKIDAGKKDSARYAAGQAWKGNERDPKGRGEREDSYIKLAFRNVANPLGEEWEQISCRVFLPILSARQLP